MQTKLLWPLLKHIKWVKNPDEYRKLHVSSIFYQNPERFKTVIFVNNMLRFWAFILHGIRFAWPVFGVSADSAICTHALTMVSGSLPDKATITASAISIPTLACASKVAAPICGVPWKFSCCIRA